MINRRLKTVPLRELCGGAGKPTVGFRVGVMVMVILEAAVIGVIVWRVLL